MSEAFDLNYDEQYKCIFCNYIVQDQQILFSILPGSFAVNHLLTLNNEYLGVVAMIVIGLTSQLKPGCEDMWWVTQTVFKMLKYNISGLGHCG